MREKLIINVLSLRFLNKMARFAQTGEGNVYNPCYYKNARWLIIKL